MNPSDWNIYSSIYDRVYGEHSAAGLRIASKDGEGFGVELPALAP